MKKKRKILSQPPKVQKRKISGRGKKITPKKSLKVSLKGKAAPQKSGKRYLSQLLQKRYSKIAKFFRDDWERSLRIVFGACFYLKKAFRPFRSKKFLTAFSILLTLLIAGSVVAYATVLYDLPDPHLLSSGQVPLTTRILDRHGRVLYKVYKDANRINLDWDEIPDNVKNTTIAIEDADFYSHFGISPKSILRALLYNSNKSDVNLYQGGSTITQQLVKNRLLNQKKTYKRKIQEVILALVTERMYSKKDILNLYLNEVSYGGTAYGIEAAAQTYFGTGAPNLSLAQAALLAGLPASPTTFSPFGLQPSLALSRKQQVLARMLALKMISQNEYDEASNEKLVFNTPKNDILAPHFVMFVKQQLVDKFGEGAVTQGGLDVTTTLDLDIQQNVESIVKRQISEIGDIYNIHNAAVLVTDPGTGEILAMNGSVDYFDIKNKGYVNVTTSLRQPGSAIKPVNYASAFQRGDAPTTVVDDSPVQFVARGAPSYVPQNYDGKFHGNVTYRGALANSYNIPAVKVLNKHGIQNMIDTGKSMGIKSWAELEPFGLSLTLGAAEVTMLDLARAYGTIFNLGVRKELKIIKEIRDGRETDITANFYSPPGGAGLLGNNNKPGMDASLITEVQAEDNKQVISQLSAWWLIDILSDNNARLPAFGPYAKLTIPGYKVAVKTGTTNEYKDNWTIGFTPNYLTAVWVGNTDGEKMNSRLVSGITGAAPIWNEVMSSLITDKPPVDFPKPQGLVEVKVCAVNGLLTCQFCPSEKMEFFTPEKVPTQKCSFRSPDECNGTKASAEGKPDEERKQLMVGCPWN